MSVKEIETAITELTPTELASLAEWFDEFQARAWDAQIERDVLAGRLDKLIEKANERFESGQTKPL